MLFGGSLRLNLGFFYLALLLLFGVTYACDNWFIKLYFLGINAATIVAYFVDKGRAIRDERRIPEATLHALCLLGGAPGAELGRTFARHKTLKFSFRVVIFIGMSEILMAVALMEGHSVPIKTAPVEQTAASTQRTHHVHHHAAHHEQPSGT